MRWTCVLGGLFLALVISCGKYEYGPEFSLRTKKNRVTGTWKIHSIIINGTDVTDAAMANLGTDYTFTVMKNYAYQKVGINVLDEGTWKFTERKHMFETQSSVEGSKPVTEEILRLTREEFWVRTNAHGHVIETQYYRCH